MRVERALRTQCLYRATLSLPSTEGNCQLLGWRVIFLKDLQRAIILPSLHPFGQLEVGSGQLPVAFKTSYSFICSKMGKYTLIRHHFFLSFLVREYRSMTSNRDQRFYRIQPQEQFSALYCTLVQLIFMH